DLELEAVEDAGEVLFQFRVPGRAADGVNGPGGADAARVVDRAVQPAEFGHGRRGQPLGVPLHGDVGGDEQRPAAARTQLLGGPPPAPRPPPAPPRGPPGGAPPPPPPPPPPAPPASDDHDLRRERPSHEPSLP